MSYITSRAYSLPNSLKQMNESVWFNMWRRKFWPYKDVFEGDVLYWYESKAKRLVWETRIDRLEKFRYPDKRLAARTIENKVGPVDRDAPYYVKAPDKGFCIAFKVSPIRRIDTSKAFRARFPQLGWTRPGEAFYKQWLEEQVVTEGATLDDVVPVGSLAERLRLLDEQMIEVSPARVKSLVEQTIRRDTKLIKSLKDLCSFRCQFPTCGIQIPKRDGGFYIEVAHIEPVARGGRSRLGNLLVLCPNHHKEFDWGERVIYEQTRERIHGRLNGKEFDIHLPLGKDAHE